MKTIATDSKNDLFINAQGNIAITKDIEALANISKNAVLVNQGELEFNKQKGVPYFETIFADSANTDMFQAHIIHTLEDLDGIERVAAFSYSVKDGVYSYSVEEITEYGTVVLNG